MSSSSQSSATNQYSTWPAGNGTQILTTVKDDSHGNPNPDFLEPSGLTIYTDADNVQWFYMASDNGMIARMQVGESDAWVSQSFLDAANPKQSDYESICVAKGRLMIGVEGGDSKGNPTYAHIKRFTADTDDDSSVGSFTGSAWKLGDVTPDNNAGMEAMTFVPDGHYPSSWLPSKQNGQSLYYGGVFLVAFQTVPGRIYVYDLPQGNSATQEVNSVHSFTSGLQASRKLSDLFYVETSDTLYALYDDDANKTDVLQELTLDDDGVSLQYQTHPPYYGCEAIAVNGSTLYLGIDQNATQFANNGGTGTLTNYVYEFDSYTDH